MVNLETLEQAGFTAVGVENQRIVFWRGVPVRLVCVIWDYEANPPYGNPPTLYFEPTNTEDLETILAESKNGKTSS